MAETTESPSYSSCLSFFIAVGKFSQNWPMFLLIIWFVLAWLARNQCPTFPEICWTYYSPVHKHNLSSGTSITPAQVAVSGVRMFPSRCEHRWTADSCAGFECHILDQKQSTRYCLWNYCTHNIVLSFHNNFCLNSSYLVCLFLSFMNKHMSFIHLIPIPMAYRLKEGHYSTVVPLGEVYWLQGAVVCCNIKEKRWVCLSCYDGWPWAAEELIGSWWGWCCREKAYQARLAH